jgi:UDP-2,3-diacylglucosamine hydrolase
MTSELIGEELILLSDLHLRMPSEERFQTLIAFLNRIDRQKCRKIIFLGDVFDFCFGPSPYCRQLYLPLELSLQDLSSSGIEVFFLEGNHEFSMKDMGWQGVTFLSGPWESTSLADGTKVAFTHGDLLGAPWHYRLFRRFIKSRGITLFCQYLLPQKWFFNLALHFASYSRSQDVRRELDHQRILRAAWGACQDMTALHHFFGHFHIPYYETKEPMSRTMMSCLSWDQPSVMTLSSGRGCSRYLIKASGEFVKIDLTVFTG